MALSISPMSTPPVSVAVTPSIVSEIERTQGKVEDLKMPDPVAPFGSGEVNSMSDAPTVIDLGDGDIELKVNNTTFKSHKHLLNDFARLREMIKGMERYSSGGSCITIYRDERGVDDFKNMFKVLYASLIKGPFEFDAPTLVSSLRLATSYEYPELRKFSIDRLEILSAHLSAIQRIELAREFDLSGWDERAFQELVERSEPITKDEAKVIGFERFEELARARENEKIKKGMEDERIRRGEEEKKKKEEETKKKEEEKKQEEEAAQRQREEEEKRKKEEEEKRQREEAERVAREEEEQKKQEEAKKAEEKK